MGTKKIYTKKQVEELINLWFARGKEEGRKELIEEILRLLRLDDRYKFAKE